MSSEPLGLIAGEGKAPLYLVKTLVARNRSVVAVTFSDDQARKLDAEGAQVARLKLGQFGKLIRTFQKAGVKEITFLGKIEKPRALREAIPDLKALLLWRKLLSRNDDAILRAVTEELEKEGFRVVSPAELAPELLTPEGVLTRRQPSATEWEDIRFGFEIAKKIGALDIGQCVVVKDRMVLAVEAVEGTDETIRRAGRFQKETVVVKVLKPTQDPRIDLPAAGLSTLKVMQEVGARVLALEAGKTLFFEREEALAFANENNLTVVGVK